MISLISVFDALEKISQSSREQRLSQNLSQKSLSEKSGVSLGVLKKFERSGKISLESLLKLAMSLGCLDNFLEVFQKKESEKLPSLDRILQQKKRKRGRV